MSATIPGNVFFVDERGKFPVKSVSILPPQRVNGPKGKEMRQLYDISYENKTKIVQLDGVLAKEDAERFGVDRWIEFEPAVESEPAKEEAAKE